MKKSVIVLTIFLIGLQLAARPTFAQRKIDFNIQLPNFKEVADTPTPTPNKTVPTSTPVPTAVPTQVPAPTAIPQPVQQSSSTQASNTTEPTPTPQIVSPLAAYTVTPTPKPKAGATTAKKTTPPTTVDKLIAAPLALAKTVFPASYYDEQRLDPRTTTMLLGISLGSIFLGLLLLTWPYLAEFKDRIFASFRREEKIVYMHSRKGLLKA